MLIAQVSSGTGARGFPPEAGIFIAVFGVILLIALIIGIFYLLTLSKALSLCDPRNRTMEPGLVWLNLIPLFSIVWMFITVNKIAESLRNEFDDRRLPAEGDYGKGLGIAYNALYLGGFIPFLGGFSSLAGFVCFIIYWVKIAGFSRILRDSPSDGFERGGRRDLDDDYRERFSDRGRRDAADDRFRDPDERTTN